MMTTSTGEPGKRLIIGVDPGGTTGLFYTIGDTFGKDDRTSYRSCYHREASDWLDVACAAADIEDVAVNMRMVAVEAFVLTPRTATLGQSDVKATMETIGAVKDRARRLGMAVIEHSPSYTKSMATDHEMRLHGWCVPAGHENRHARDAARVALVQLYHMDPHRIRSETAGGE